MNLDKKDQKILAQLQRDADLSVNQLAERVGLSRNACWRRMRLLEETGVIKARIALIDPEKIGLGATVLIMIRTDRHNEEWARKFREVTGVLPEVVAVYRLAGDVDYLLKVVVSDTKAYDHFYQRLIKAITISDVSASFVMEVIKDTHELPLTQI